MITTPVLLTQSASLDHITHTEKFERDEPFLVARRRASPELLDEGRKRLDELMASYAQCLVRNQWPAFEPDNDTTKNAWAPVALQPWLTSGHGAFGGYFAPSATLDSTSAHAPNPTAS